MCILCVCVWVQVSMKLLNLKGLCTNYIPCVFPAHIPANLPLLENIYSFLFLHFSIEEFKASGIKKNQTHNVSNVMFQYISYNIQLIYFFFSIKSIKHS